LSGGEDDGISLSGERAGVSGAGEFLEGVTVDDRATTILRDGRCGDDFVVGDTDAFVFSGCEGEVRVSTDVNEAVIGDEDVFEREVVILNDDLSWVINEAEIAVERGLTDGDFLRHAGDGCVGVCDDAVELDEACEALDRDVG